MKRFQFFVLTLLIAVGAGAQQLANSSLYDMYGPLHNPATAGVNQYATLGGTFKKQWSDIPGSPQTGLLFGSTYLPKAKVGLGGYLYNDQTGPITNNGLQASFAYHIPMKNNATFSLGLEARVMQFKYDQAKLLNTLGTDPVIMGDPERIKGDAGFGVAYSSKKFQVGVSASQLIQSKLGLYEGTATTGTPNEEAKLSRHYYAHGYYNWDVDKATRIIPHLLVIYLPNAPTELQGGFRIEHHNLFWYGLALKKEQSWMISAGLRLKERFNIGYSFDIFTTPLSVYNAGSSGHEIMLRYDFIK
jgi:type IX secretion system PorP/SprF family membrane protein